MRHVFGIFARHSKHVGSYFLRSMNDNVVDGCMWVEASSPPFEIALDAFSYGQLNGEFVVIPLPTGLNRMTEEVLGEGGVLETANSRTRAFCSRRW